MGKVLGLAGGSGSGKSTICRMLEEHYNAYTIDADKIGHEIIKKGFPAYDEILNTFDSKILYNNGEINRKELGKIVFSDKHSLEKLNLITYKHIKNEIENSIKVLQDNDPKRLIILDCALLINTSLKSLADGILFIDADFEIKVARIMQRDNISMEYAKNRINSQVFDICATTCTIIYNNTNLDDIKDQIYKYVEELL